MSSRSSIEPGSVLLFLIPFLLGAGCGDESKHPATTGRMAEYETERVELSTITEHHEVPGTVRSTTRSTVSARLLGTITSVVVAEGDRVRRGQPLITIDGRELDARVRRASAAIDEVEESIHATEAALSGAEANLDLARVTFGRYETLRQRRSVSPQEFDEIEARYKGAAAERTRLEHARRALEAKKAQVMAELAVAKTERSWTIITSSVDGVVTARHVDPGNQAQPGLPLLEIDDPASFRLDVQVDESRLRFLHVGDTVDVDLESLGATIQGNVEAIAPAVDAASRSALVKITLQQSTGLQSGMFARARFPAGERKAVVVPSSAIVRRGQLEGVYVRDDSGNVHYRLIRTGRSIDGGTEVLSGLEPGARIVTVGTEPETLFAQKKTEGP